MHVRRRPIQDFWRADRLQSVPLQSMPSAIRQRFLNHNNYQALGHQRNDGRI
jgi:hypothetical protein